MKKLITILFATATFLTYAQDTTALRWVGVNEEGKFNFFNTADSSNFTNYSAGYDKGFGVFMSNKDSLLYTIFGESSGGTGDRNLYSINPFTGTYTLVRDLTTSYISSADISADGKTLYIIEGQAVSGALGRISKVDLGTGAETILTTALGDSGVSSYGMEFSPTDSSLYIYEGHYSGTPRLQVINLLTLTNTSTPLVGWSSQLHGAKWSGSGKKFIVTAGYGCDMLISDATGNNLVSFENMCSPLTTDVEEFKTLRAKSSTLNICPNTTDSASISVIYPGTTFKWFKNGVLLPLTSSTIKVFAPGVYRALFNIDTTGKFMWSEKITVVHAAVPLVTVTQSINDSLICPGETIVLTGASGGTLKWFRNGVLIPTATASTYSATMSGRYNQLKTNSLGCADSAAVGFKIKNDVGCASGINELNANSIKLFPNPVKADLTIESIVTINSIVVYDIIGKEVYRSENINQLSATIDLSKLVGGSYFVKIYTTTGEITKKIQK